jgi:acyl-CoA thioesterase FadM
VSATAHHEVQMRWQDLDGLGHVNHVVVLTYLEEGRDAFLRGHGIGPDDYVVGRCAVSYIAEIDPSRRSVTVETGVAELGNSSLRTAERILDDAGEALIEAEFGIVLWDSGERRPRPISDAERASLTGGAGEGG